MTAVTPQAVREYLSGFCGLESTDDGVTDVWISNRISNSIIPYIKSVTGYTFSGLQQFTEYYSGNGTATLTLNHAPIISLDSIELIGPTYSEIMYTLANFLVIYEQGILKWRIGQDRSFLPISSNFPRGIKNIKVVYTAGYADLPVDMAEAIILMAAEKVLAMVADQTGGGALSVQSWSRTWGDKGMYTNIRQKLAMEAYSIIRRYVTGVIG